MIVIRAAMRIKPGMESAAQAAMVEVMTASQAEPGCVAYAFTADLVDPRLVHVTEIWETEAALHAHFGRDAFAAFRASSGDLVDRVSMNAWAGDLAPYQLALG